MRRAHRHWRRQWRALHTTLALVRLFVVDFIIDGYLTPSMARSSHDPGVSPLGKVSPQFPSRKMPSVSAIPRFHDFGNEKSSHTMLWTRIPTILKWNKRSKKQSVSHFISSHCSLHVTNNQCFQLHGRTKEGTEVEPFATCPHGLWPCSPRPHDMYALCPDFNQTSVLASCGNATFFGILAKLKQNLWRSHSRTDLVLLAASYACTSACMWPPSVPLEQRMQATAPSS